ncbi:MAG TPA: ABC transporter substrate-binding protein [Pyrinomonadaceae bacterium]|nr:ABC transporter substrate-binding protein [Pyrinomonadaceae bacterium]
MVPVDVAQAVNHQPEFLFAYEGFFEREGLTVCYNQVRSSDQQWADLFANRYDIISAASDTTITRVVNFGLPVSIVAGLEMNNDQVLAVNTARGIHTFEDLRGKPIAVDAPDTGFSFLLRKILAEHGLRLENGDYSLQPVGGVALRYAALQAGQTAGGRPVYASMINYPFAARLQEPVAVLARAEDYVFPYQGGAFAVRHDYSAGHPDTITRFLRAIIAGGEFARRPRNRATVVAHIAAELGVSAEVAERELEASLDRGTGENHKAKLDRQALVGTILLRHEFGGFGAPLGDVNQLVNPCANCLYDDRFWKAAIDASEN